MKIVGDLETNGLLDTGVDTIWCGSFENIDTGEKFRFIPETIIELPSLLSEAELIIMHNGVDFDREVIKLILDYEIPLEKMWDTLIWSKLLYPDRKVPKGWRGPPAPHSIEAWGMRFGRKKPEHEDWSRFSTEMLYRCDEDREIGKRVYFHLLKEMEDAHKCR